MLARGCDTMVALPPVTRHGQTLFAKNSDRAATECQPLMLRDRQAHPDGARLHFARVEIPEARVTYRHVGSRPWWCLGYEHGFNEHQVVIGNEGLASRVRPEQPGLIGMELVRLGLERGSTAAEAVDVIAGAVARWGQGIFPGCPPAGRYDNGFLVADPREAYVLETAGPHWAVRRVEQSEGISNVYSTRTGWDRISADAESAAAREGWWNAGDGRLGFGGAFGTPAVLEEGIACGARRRARSCAVLRRASGRIDVETMMALLTDHSDGKDPDGPFVVEPAGGQGICFHPSGPNGDRGGCSAASMVADLCADGSRLPIYWCSLYSPCLSVFFPVFVEAALPECLSVGGAEPSDDSPWWLFRRLVVAASRSPQSAAAVRARWATVQERLVREAAVAARDGRRLIDEGRTEEAQADLSAYVRRNVECALAAACEMLAEVGTADGRVPRLL